MDMYLQATMGLYEGETSLYFMIAQGDFATVEWLLEQNARSFFFSAGRKTFCFIQVCSLFTSRVLAIINYQCLEKLQIKESIRLF